MVRNDVVRVQGFLGSRSNGFLQKILGPAFRNKTPNTASMQSLKNIGKGVGLDESEIQSATKYNTGAISRFCSRLIFLTIVSFFIFLALAGLANNDGMLDYFFHSNTTYLPGTRYASIKPKDFK